MALSQVKVACRWGINMFLFLIAILLATSCRKSGVSLPFYNSADFTAEWIEKEDARFSVIHTIDTFKMQDQNGASFPSDSLKGKIHVVNFFFTACPGICPRMTHQLKTIQETFRDHRDVEIVSFSVMPWADSVPILKEYADRNDILSSKWHLLTGDNAKIKLLGRRSYFAEKRQGTQKSITDFLHTENALLVDRHFRIRGIYNATQREDIARLTDDIRNLKEEL